MGTEKKEGDGVDHDAGLDACDDPVDENSKIINQDQLRRVIRNVLVQRDQEKMLQQADENLRRQDEMNMHRETIRNIGLPFN